MKRNILIWLPVFLLPASNLVSMLIENQNHEIFIPSIVGAVVEEIIFRWLMLDKWLFRERWIKRGTAILVGAIAFSLMHLWNLRNGTSISEVLIQILFAFSFSIWAGTVAWKSTWLIPLLAHVLLNATAGEESLWLSLIVSGIVLTDGVMVIRCLWTERNI